MPVAKWLKPVQRLLQRARQTDVPAASGCDCDRVAARRDYPGSQRRQYRVHVPPGYRPGAPVPLVMVLHGCLQNHADIQAISGFDAIADRHGFIVVYPFVTHYTELRRSNCWGWWLKKHVRPGSGEVEDLWRVIEAVCGEFAVDRQRIHIAGLSSGAGMAVAALTVHVGRFASGAAVAGVAYGESPRAVLSLPFGSRRFRAIADTVALMARARNGERTPVPLFIVHSHDDPTVPLQAATNLRDAWLAYFSPGRQLLQQDSAHTTRGTPWQHTRYRHRFGRSLVETVFLSGPGHGWYGGASGEFSFPDAPPISALMWAFFHRHARPQGVR